MGPSHSQMTFGVKAILELSEREFAMRLQGTMGEV